MRLISFAPIFSSGQLADAFVEGSFQGAKLYGASFVGLNLTNARFDGSHMADWEAYGDIWSGLSWEDYENTRWHYVVNFTGARLDDRFHEIDRNG